MTERFRFMDHPVSLAAAQALPNHLVLLDVRSGRLVVRMRTEVYVGVPNRRAA